MSEEEKTHPTKRKNATEGKIRAETAQNTTPRNGIIYQINDPLWKGSFYPRLPNGKRKKFNVYAETRNQCETKLAEMITQKKAEIAEEKANQKEGAD